MKSWLSFALALVLVASTAAAAVETFMTRNMQGKTVPFGQVSCGTGATTIVSNNVGVYDRLSILIKNAAALGGADVFICPGSATCTISTGFPLGPHEGLWLDWSYGPITCVVAAGTVTVAYIEERG